MNKAKRPPLKVGQKIKFVGPVSGVEFSAGNPALAEVLCVYPTSERWTVETLKIKTTDIDMVYEGTIARRQVTHILKPRPPKAKEERVTVWAHRESVTMIPPLETRRVALTPAQCEGDSVIRLVELRDSEAIVSRQALADAFWTGKREATTNGLGPGCFPSPEDVLSEMLKALGLVDAGLAEEGER